MPKQKNGLPSLGVQRLLENSTGLGRSKASQRRAKSLAQRLVGANAVGGRLCICAAPWAAERSAEFTWKPEACGAVGHEACARWLDGWALGPEAVLKNKCMQEQGQGSRARHWSWIRAPSRRSSLQMRGKGGPCLL